MQDYFFEKEGLILKNGYPFLLRAAFKDYLWGGTRLRDSFHLPCDNLDKIAEAWVLSCHPDGESIIQNGALAGMTLTQAVRENPALCGAHCEKFERFPVLIKLIDAKDNLSVQVHPADDYALQHENEYGKTEMWYVIDCEPGAYLYYGFQRSITKEQLQNCIAQNTLDTVLNKVMVHPGDCLFIRAGTVHAIGAGILIAEIQQNSNTTYRVYDYGRTDADGAPRPLHIQQALDIAICDRPADPVLHQTETGPLFGCDYFQTSLLNVAGSAKITANAASFRALLVVLGSCAVDGVRCNAGQCIFLPAGYGCATLVGNARIIVTDI